MSKIFIALSVALCILSAGIASASGIGELAANKIYSVNIIAYSNCPKTSDNSQRIIVAADYVRSNITGQLLVNISKQNKIFLVPGPTFRVLDSTACDVNTTNGATLQLEGTVGVSVPYSMWVRLVGKPNTAIDSILCATDPNNSNLIVCGGAYTKVRYTGKGNPVFEDVTNQLLTLNGKKLFDATYENYFWDWGTTGKATAQVWFVQPAD